MSDDGVDLGRFARTLTLILFVTAVFIIIAAQRLDGAALQVGVVAIGSVGFITAIIGFLIAASQYYDSNPDQV